MSEGAGLDDAGEVADSADRQAEENADRGVPRKMDSPPEPQPVGAKPRDGEQQTGEHRDQRAGPGCAGIEDVAEPEEERHADRRCDRPDGFDQAAIGVAAKRNLFRESGDGERDQVEKKQTEGTRLRPEVDVQGSSQRHRQDGENDEAPAERGAECPFTPRRGTLRQTEDFAE